MRILVISDIHGNLTALEAVLEHAGEVDAVWCLGDLVGYGPDPNECVERIKSLPNLLCILGNHDAAVSKLMDISSFNPEARLSIEWTIEQLNEENARYLAGLPNMVVQGQVTVVHGSPRNPTHEYLLDTYLATLNFSYFETPACFVGHTHLPVQFLLENGRGYAELLIPREGIEFEIEPRSILNPGSVGQPRDRDVRASYALFDPQKHTWSYQRAEYDIPAVQERMKRASLPDRHVQRIAAGW
jgi:predicted phosphodiesterase